MAETPENRAQALLERGATLYEGGKLYEALSCWKQVLQIDPENEIAAEYLRFIEDNFQIGVDAFIEHNEPAPPAVTGPPPAVVPVSVAPAESIEELDWSEILEDGADVVVKPPPVPQAPAPEPDLEDFFTELEPGSLRADPGEEAAAWGAHGSEPESPGGFDDLSSAELMPDQDPMAISSTAFTAGYTPPPLAADHGSISAEILPGDPGSRRRGFEGRTVDDRPAPASVSAPPPAPPRAPARAPEVVDESLDLMLDRDFKAWDDRHGNVTRPGPPGYDARELHDLISGGLDNAKTVQASPPGIAAELSLDGPPPPVIDRPLSPPPVSAFDPDEDSVVDPLDEFNADFVVAEPGQRGAEPSGSGEEPAAGKVMRRTKRKSAPIKPPDEKPAGAKVNRDRAPTPVRGFPVIDAGSMASPDDELESLLKAGLADLDAIERGEQPSTPGMNRLSVPAPDVDLDAVMAEARRKLQADDFTGALALVEQVLAGDPDHAEARRYLEENTTRLLAMYRSRLGKLSRVPRVKLRPQEIIWQSLDHRAGFLLSQVDGRTSFEDIIDISGMSELEASRILARLVEHGVVG